MTAPKQITAPPIPTPNIIFPNSSVVPGGELFRATVVALTGGSDIILSIFIIF
jgi:hypothetical protein